MSARLQRFCEGVGYDAWRYFGAHPTTVEGAPGFRFRTWAPRARRLSVIGDFNDWQPTEMIRRDGEEGVWELFVAGATAGHRYKLRVDLWDGTTSDRADPFAFAAENRSVGIVISLVGLPRFRGVGIVDRWNRILAAGQHQRPCYCEHCADTFKAASRYACFCHLVCHFSFLDCVPQPDNDRSLFPDAFIFQHLWDKGKDEQSMNLYVIGPDTDCNTGNRYNGSRYSAIDVP